RYEYDREGNSENLFRKRNRPARGNSRVTGGHAGETQAPQFSNKQQLQDTANMLPPDIGIAR
ncbi:hypothetical protein FQN52_006603, partial [Onygenales sp. PD_12]